MSSMLAAPASATTLFSHIELAPRDPILGMTEAFRADPRAHKINLGVGVYLDENGQLPVMRAVAAAEQRSLGQPRNYLPIEGLARYCAAVRRLLLGEQDAALGERMVCVQTLGGTGALALGAQALRRLVLCDQTTPRAAISTPSWENHRAIFESAGFRVENYPYYDPATHGVDFAAMCATLERTEPRTVVVLHAACHNPTGADLDLAQWRRVVELCRERALIPLLDLAYQGFSESLTADRVAVRLFAESGMAFLVANSFSKTFSLYGERVGALSLMTASADESQRLLSQLKRLVRTHYSNPPTYGAHLVSQVLHDEALRQDWEKELDTMRLRIRTMREKLSTRLAELGSVRDFSFITRQRGMFSYSGIPEAQMTQLREQFGIYGLASGRICVAALNAKNLDTVAQAIVAVERAAAPPRAAASCGCCCESPQPG